MSRDEDDQAIILAHRALNFMTRWWSLLHMSFFRREEDMRATSNSTTTPLSMVYNSLRWSLCKSTKCRRYIAEIMP